MSKLGQMVDMKMDSEEQKEFSQPSPPVYPYGLCISLCEKELEKLGLDNGDLDVGDMLHIHALAKVTSVSCFDNENGSSCRVELQICYMNGVEDEDDENEEVDRSTPRLYRK